MDSLAFNSDDKKERTDKALAGLITLLIHGGILLFLLLYIIITPIPPYPEPTAPELEVALAGGGGGGYSHTEAINTGKATSADNNKAKTTETNTPTVNNNVEPSVPIPSGKSTVIPKKIDTVPKPQEPSVQLVNLENKFIKSSKENSGENTSQQGEQGGGGDLTGNGPGQGGGIGSGIGRGNGPGKGDYNLAGRELVRRPNLITNNPEQGEIVVGITVDQDGNVTDAVPGVKGTTITDASLFILVKNAALKTKFNKSPNDTPEQYGTITFRFTIQ